MKRVGEESGLATSYDWVEYFYQNAREPILPWSEASRLSGAERVAVIPSIQQFQLGEGASGARMLERAQRFSRETGDLGLIAALKLFLREEQRHSKLLAQFLQRENAPCLQGHWVQKGFRYVRGLAGLELCLKVLVTAELIARPYYAALRDATGSPLLRSICQRIIDEEGAHLRFQAWILQRFESRHARVTRTAIKMAHLVLFVFTAGLVWMEHQGCLSRRRADAASILERNLAGVRTALPYAHGLGRVRLSDRPEDRIWQVRFDESSSTSFSL